MNTAVNNNPQKPLEIVIAELERNLKVLEQNYQQAVSNLSVLKARVETDDLTHLLRRGAFMQKLSALLAESHAQNTEVHLLMIDVDHFKKVNDNYGHQTGDQVLERVALLVREFVGPQASPSVSFAGRYGGEEIIVAFQGTEAQAAAMSESLRQSVARERIRTSHDLPDLSVSVSVGRASSVDFGYDRDQLIAKADEALYQAKDSGRNRVVRAA